MEEEEEGGTADVLKGGGVGNNNRPERKEGGGKKTCRGGVWLQLGRDAETPPVVPKLSLAQRDAWPRRERPREITLLLSLLISCHPFPRPGRQSCTARVGFSWSTARLAQMACIQLEIEGLPRFVSRSDPLMLCNITHPTARRERPLIWRPILPFSFARWNEGEG